jgi:uncharacterized protein YhbP (UPF0306 family)
MKPEEQIKRSIASCRLMQIATESDGKPWICTVHFVQDDNQNLYWLSLPSRRHSQDLDKNNRAAVAIVVKDDKPVIGIQAEGSTIVIKDAYTIKDIMKKYVEKYEIGEQFYDNFVAGKNQHWLYKFTPERFSLFDEVNFKETSPEEWRPQS